MATGRVIRGIPVGIRLSVPNEVRTRLTNVPISGCIAAELECTQFSISLSASLHPSADLLRALHSPALRVLDTVLSVWCIVAPPHSRPCCEEICLLDRPRVHHAHTSRLRRAHNRRWPGAFQKSTALRGSRSGLTLRHMISKKILPLAPGVQPV